MILKLRKLPKIPNLPLLQSCSERTTVSPHSVNSLIEQALKLLLNEYTQVNRQCSLVGEPLCKLTELPFRSIHAFTSKKVNSALARACLDLAHTHCWITCFELIPFTDS